MAEIEYFYAAHSAFAYIGSALLSRIAAEGGHTIVHRPYDLRRSMTAQGHGATGGLTPQRRAYFFGRELVRWAEHRGVPIMSAIPTHHANDIGLPNRVLIAALESGADIDRLAHAFLAAHWVDDADLADPDTLRRLCTVNGCDPDKLLAEADGDVACAVHERNTDEAIRRSVFGSPTYFVGGDMFYGQDHLELVARALDQPFRGTWPPAA